MDYSGYRLLNHYKWYEKDDGCQGLPSNYRNGFNNRMPNVLSKLSTSFLSKFCSKRSLNSNSNYLKMDSFELLFTKFFIADHNAIWSSHSLTVVLEGHTHKRNQGFLCCRAKNSNIFKLIHAGKIINDWINIKVIPKASHAHTFLWCIT